MPGDEPFDQLPCNADLSREGWQVFNSEPGSIFDLGIIEGDFATGISGRETDHERMGKGPGLAAEVADIPDDDADLLPHLANNSLLQGLAGLNKPCEDAVDAGRKVAGAGEEEFMLALDQDNDGRGEPRKMEQAALRAFLGPFGQ